MIYKKINKIIEYITGPDIIAKLNLGINIFDEMNLEDLSENIIARKINASFLVILADKDKQSVVKARSIFKQYKNDAKWKTLIQLYEFGLDKIPEEISVHSMAELGFASKIDSVLEKISTLKNMDFDKALSYKISKVFFPEGAELDNINNRKLAIDKLRRKRKVIITDLNPEPIEHPAEQILFTSNILATKPLDEWDLDALDFSADIREKLYSIKKEKQKYWYDHPIPLGITSEKNEAIYGLSGLNEMVEFEKTTGRIPGDSKLTCLLSASTTHDGLHTIVKNYFECELKKNGQFHNLEIFIFTETDTNRIIDEILIPLIDHYVPDVNKNMFYDIFGVDGEYGRHYSFLKAIAAFWQVFINHEIKATFKIDLDQVFPQQALIKETGHSALDNFRTPLWGAKGLDSSGKEIELSMIAGTLVNQDDIGKSIFTPDVTFPSSIFNSPDSLIFNSKIPQALSTEAEMMMQYEGDESNEVIQRIHVTGGTNGILIDALRKHRPFTPTIIGRAEDQSYLLSVLFKHSPALRYLHKPGLIMRHDKHTFASEAISAAAAGKLIGDYIRILIFSAYAQALPWKFDHIKSEIDPFTGAFVSPIPITVVMLRFALKILKLSEDSDGEFLLDFQRSGSERLMEWFDRLRNNKDYFKNIYELEAQGWNTFYDLLDIAETKLKENDDFVIGLKESVINIIENCRIRFD